MSRAYYALPATEELWAQFDYKPLTGELVRKSTNRAAKASNSAGYITTMCNKKLYQTHRLIFSWCGGECATAVVHHRDSVRTNNCFWNLKKASHAENSRTAGGKGWKLTANGKRYEARICIDYKYIYIGTFDTEAEAAAAYKKASLELHGAFSPYSDE